MDEKQNITVKEISWTDETRWLLLRRFNLAKPGVLDGKLKYQYNDEFIDRYICYECARKKGGRHVQLKLFTFHDGTCAYCEEEKPLTDIMDWYWPESYKSNLLDCVMDWWKDEYIANPGKYKGSLYEPFIKEMKEIVARQKEEMEKEIR